MKPKEVVLTCVLPSAERNHPQPTPPKGVAHILYYFVEEKSWLELGWYFNQWECLTGPFSTWRECLRALRKSG